jgi:hypothetical protein
VRAIRLFASIFAPIAQSVERLPFKEKVLGSNPSGRTRRNKSGLLQIFSYLCEPERDDARQGRGNFQQKIICDHKLDSQ